MMSSKTSTGTHPIRIELLESRLMLSAGLPVAAVRAAAPAITGLTLVNADTGKPIAGYDPIPQNATLDLGALPTSHLNIRADTAPAKVGSVRFSYDSNSRYRVESSAPYAFAGDYGNGKYYRWTPTAGSHTVSATIYSKSGASGVAGASLSIHFTVLKAAVHNVWSVGKALPVKLAEVAGGIIGNTLYLVGEGSSSTFAYDLKANTWSKLPARPFVGDHHAAEVIDGKLYLFGGIDGGSGGKVQIFDPVAKRWTLGADMPFAAGSCSSTVIGGQVYVAGGILGETTTSQAARYDPVANSWTPIASMPRGLNHSASATDGSKLYIFGGRDGGNHVANGFNTVEIYDPASDTWSTSEDPASGIAPLPQARGGMGKAVYYQGDFYIMGGETKSGPGATSNHVYNRVDVYNLATNTWRLAAPMPTARHGIFPLLFGDKIYVAGGGTASGYSFSTSLEIYQI